MAVVESAQKIEVPGKNCWILDTQQILYYPDLDERDDSPFRLMLAGKGDSYWDR